MAYELRPRTAKLPAAADVARVLALEFGYLRVDADDGLKQARAMADEVDGATEPLVPGRPPQAIEAAAKLRALRPGEALTVEFGDTSELAARTVVLPGEPLRFEFASGREQAEARPLIERCARLLDCDIHVL